MVRPESGGDYEKIFTEGYLFHTDEKQVLADVLRNYLGGQRGLEVLDVGPGDGTVTEVLAAHAKSVTVLEPQAVFGQKLTQRFAHANVVSGLLQDADFKGSSFDLILCSHMLYYIPTERWEQQLKKMIGWLKPGGELLVVMNPGDSDWFRSVSELSALLQLVPGFSYIAPEHFFRACGAANILTYEAVFDFRGSARELEYFLVELGLLIPRRLISPEQRDLVHGYVNGKLSAPERFVLKNKFLIGIWKR